MSGSGQGRGRYTRQLSVNKASVCITLDAYGVPTIEAASRADAYWALGYCIARDRLFQIDILRRRVSGHLAEIVGRFALQSDIKQRTLGLQQVAREIFARLPPEHCQILQAYADGINAYRQQYPRRPLECFLLGYTPAAWTPQDCVLIGLSLFQDLTSVSEQYQRSVKIMRATLAPDVVAFFTSDEDLYPEVLLGGTRGMHPFPELPLASLQDIVKQRIPVQGQSFRDEVQQVRGSNGWVVSPSRTGNGRAILANDMHLSLTAPVIWYAATLRYQDRLLTGMTVPGVPGITLGSNGHIAWGFTNTSGDFLDLLPLEIHPEQDNLYQTPDGWQEFTVKTEDIAIRGKQPEQVIIRSTIWGPVSPRPLLGKAVALRWTLLDPDATNCAILDIDQVRTVQDAIDLMHHFGAPPMNAMLADSAGHIGWTLCGKIPLRPSSLLSENAGPMAGSWEEYIPAEKVPCLVDPPEGFLITANNRTTGADYPFLIGSNYASGYRATQIASQLRQMQNVTEAEMFDLQLESICTFYQFYQQLSLTLLTPAALAKSPFLKEVHQEVKAWDGRAETQSRGIALLVAFREALATRILEAYLSPCLQKEETFLYGWNAMERPLRTILTVRDPAIFPFEETFADWEAFLLATLEECARKELKKIKGKELSQLTWGKVHRTRIAHPLGLANPLLGKLLNMPEKPLAGTPFSIRASAPGYGVTVRLVVSPSHEQEGKYHLPTGQSGRIFSRNYRDQYRYWLKGIGLAVAARSKKHV